MGVAATEHAFVVELMQAGQPERRPAVQQMVATCATGLVEVLRQANSVRVVIDRMKVLNFRAAAHMLGNDIGGEDGIDIPSLGPRIIGGRAGCSKRVGEVVLRQNALNGWYTGQGRDMQLLE